MTMASPSELEDFLQGPLVTWLQSCLDNPDRITDFDDLADGTVIHEVLLLIDPEPLHHGVLPSLGNAAIRVRNFDCIIKNIKTLYEEELCQLIVNLPDCVRLGRDLKTKEGLEDLQLLLLLLLGCAVQCPNKQNFIEGIKTLHVDAQHGLVHCIKQVTESQQIVLTPDNFDSLSNDLLICHVRHLIKQRDRYLQYWAGQEERKCGTLTPTVMAPTGERERGESQHLAVELADWKARLRKQRQELEEKSEALAEMKEELEHSRAQVTKLKSEMQDLKQQARATKAYRDELDSLREKAERCDRLEAEVTKYRDKLSDLEFYRSRVEELRQDNRVLEETREMLEEQLARARKRGDHLVQLEASVLQYKQTINDLILERDANNEKLQQMFEENAELSLLSRSVNNTVHDSDHLDEDTDTGSGDNSLSEQLTSNATARALRLELENRRLAQTVESLQEAAFKQTSETILDLEKEKKKLSLTVEDLEGTKKKLQQQNSELENTVKNAQRDTKKMQELRDSVQLQLEIRSEEAESLQREKQRLERRVLELESSLESARATAERVQEQQDSSNKAAAMERDINKLKEALEAKSVTLDEVTMEAEKNLKEKLHLAKKLEEINSQVARLQEVERDMQELERRCAMDQATLSALQSDLVAEKLNTQQLKSSLDKLGLPVDHLMDMDNALDKILSSPEVLKLVKQRLADGDDTVHGLAEQNAKLEVDVATLQSQIMSMTSQLTALQLANSQLVAEKDEVLKNHSDLQNEHQQMLVDQLTLQKLHEQLTTEYDGLVKEKEELKVSYRDLRAEQRQLKDNYDILSTSIESLRSERDTLREESRSLNNLRAEHSKLKDDFRNLFTASEKVKSDYRGLQEEYKVVRAETCRLRLNVTELQGELASRNDHITSIEVQLSKLSSQCEILNQVKMGLEEDRRSLMEHVSLLLSQYHELLTHSLEDKEHYHTEEKLFRDKLNSLCRQKEKLEEKIMEHYRRLDSCPTKKKSFGANLVRRVRKAGSELISKSRRSWHEAEARSGRGTDSDTSLEEVRTRQDGLSNLGTPGSRRAVYYSGDENNSASANDREETKSSIGEPPVTSTPQPDTTGNNMVVYNRVTNVLGCATPPHSPHHNAKKQPPPPADSKTGAPPVWFRRVETVRCNEQNQNV
ncbi:protein Daple-like [Macrosteles quadrilineatus]|uniref:protein Daple-like n=1 Tax=Macrosteles quadrilineatus TaxID=74068 RepID=UPI0023E25A48|nr:protein Daple-like [Macrosteles quadrilineatus]